MVCTTIASALAMWLRPELEASILSLATRKTASSTGSLTSLEEGTDAHDRNLVVQIEQERTAQILACERLRDKGWSFEQIKTVLGPARS